MGTCSRPRSRETKRCNNNNIKYKLGIEQCESLEKNKNVLIDKFLRISSVKSVPQPSSRCRQWEMHDNNANGIGTGPHGQRSTNKDATVNVLRTKMPCSPSTGAISKASSLTMKQLVDMNGTIGAGRRCLPQRIRGNTGVILTTRNTSVRLPTGHLNNMKMNVEPESEL